MDISFEELDILWTTHYYDGPLSGVCKYCNYICYFDFINWGGFEEIENKDLYPELHSYIENNPENTSRIDYGDGCYDITFWKDNIEYTYNSESDTFDIETDRTYNLYKLNYKQIILQYFIRWLSRKLTKSIYYKLNTYYNVKDNFKLSNEQLIGEVK